MADREYVFDTEPLEAFLSEEPGHGDVAEQLGEVEVGRAEGRIAEVTASEVFHLIARIEGDDGTPTRVSLRIADWDVRALGRRESSSAGRTGGSPARSEATEVSPSAIRTRSRSHANGARRSSSERTTTSRTYRWT